jgi:hypothetical protein
MSMMISSSYCTGQGSLPAGSTTIGPDAVEIWKSTCEW